MGVNYTATLTVRRSLSCASFSGMSIFDLIASEAEQFARLLKIGDWGTSGPPVTAPPVEPEPLPAPLPAPPPTPSPPLPPPEPVMPIWSLDGWYRFAKKLPACPGRVGGPIKPWSTVFHTTDMLPDEFSALISAWTSRASDGACAHFLIGRDESQGLIQFVPVSRNGNHAGGKPPPGGHGWYVVDGKNIHPNLVAVGIEVHCAGGVRLLNGAWRLFEDGKAHGMVLPKEDVIEDPLHAGRGWHVVTDYQRDTLDRLLSDLEEVLQPMPASASTISTGEDVPQWGRVVAPRVVGHVTLDPTNRSDPWPNQMAFLRARHAVLSKSK